uniref:ankyrin repeat domain-containing protein 7 n=1 Tax=Jaculus jaculus TaxID=51337 RepID=UPI001E1B169E|nr:ankyrin repeat domain-containing protein 7 [Jaculus jaculus]
MKKLLTFRKRTDVCHSLSSDMCIGLASTSSSLSVGANYNLPDKHLKPLRKPASVGDLKMLTMSLQLKKPEANMRGKGHRTLLHRACANGNENMVTFLITKQYNINVQDSENRTPLIKAVQCQKENCASLLLNHGADINRVDCNCNTALHYAVCGESISLVKHLIENKANLEAKNKDGYTPLLLAVAENNEKMVEFLLKSGADVNASDKNQSTALMIALSIEPTNLVSLLLQQDLDLSCRDIYGFTAEDYASFNGFTMYHQLIDNYGQQKKELKPLRLGQHQPSSSDLSLKCCLATGSKWPEHVIRHLHFTVLGENLVCYSSAACEQMEGVEWEAGLHGASVPHNLSLLLVHKALEEKVFEFCASMKFRQLDD